MNNFHSTPLGSKVQDFSYLALSPANPNWKGNWWTTAKISGIKGVVAVLASMASQTLKTAGEYTYGALVGASTLTDMGATATCYGSMISPPTGPPGH